MKLSEDPNVPVLKGWVNITEAAELLGITRQHSYKRAKNGGYKSLHRIGTSPAYVVSTKEIDELLAAKKEAEAKRAAKALEDAAADTAS